MARPSEASAVLSLLRSRPAAPGGGRLLCIDGPSGSGKTTLARQVARLEPGTRVLHMDELVEGWSGLPTVEARLEGLLRPIAAGRPGRYRRYDWHRGEYAETVRVEPVPLLIVEGVGSGSRAVADLVTVLVWVEAPREVRMRRGIERDGDAFAPHWDAWSVAEQEHFARHSTPERADLTVRTD